MMNPTERVVTRVPLAELWRQDGFSTKECAGVVSASDIVTLLRHGPVHFVVVDVGKPPEWIDLTTCFDYWKLEVQAHVADPGSKVILSKFAGEYCYFASKWASDDSVPVVLLEKHH